MVNISYVSSIQEKSVYSHVVHGLSVKQYLYFPPLNTYIFKVLQTELTKYIHNQIEQYYDGSGSACFICTIHKAAAINN